MMNHQADFNEIYVRCSSKKVYLSSNHFDFTYTIFSEICKLAYGQTSGLRIFFCNYA